MMRIRFGTITQIHTKIKHRLKPFLLIKQKFVISIQQYFISLLIILLCHFPVYFGAFIYYILCYTSFTNKNVFQYKIISKFRLFPKCLHMFKT